MGKTLTCFGGETKEVGEKFPDGVRSMGVFEQNLGVYKKPDNLAYVETDEREEVKKNKDKGGDGGTKKVSEGN